MENGLIMASIASGLIAITAFKGREIRATLSMSGEGWNKLHPDVKTRAEAVLIAADKNPLFKEAGLKVGIYEGYREIERQREVMGSGNSDVSSPLRSYHPWGLAVDFVFLDRWGWTWGPARVYWDELGKLIKAQGFEWGGDWKNFDGPHAQLPPPYRSNGLIAKFASPENFITWA